MEAPVRHSFGLASPSARGPPAAQREAGPCAEGRGHSLNEAGLFVGTANRSAPPGVRGRCPRLFSWIFIPWKPLNPFSASMKGPLHQQAGFQAKEQTWSWSQHPKTWFIRSFPNNKYIKCIFGNFVNVKAGFRQKSESWLGENLRTGAAVLPLERLSRTWRFCRKSTWAPTGGFFCVHVGPPGRETSSAGTAQH